ncbi:TolC family protein [Phenylobacterium sp.]|jgi:cobalt-zinc-cadmium efflux system outer membrane protein|uniref:TolC family protein n=1 Tax=Phenylobacterium sp. TaxID=1871053 RepID=UPI0035B12A46
MSPRFWAPGLVLLALARPALAEPLTYDQALARAATSAPTLGAADLRIQAARSATRAAGALPDPQLKLGVDNYPISGPMAGRFGADQMTMATVGVMQEFPNGAQRRAEAASARAEVGMAEAQRAMSAREVRLATALAWLDLYYAQTRLAALDAVLVEIEPLWKSSPAGVAAGAARPAMALAPIRQRAALQDQRDELAAAAGRAQAELARWTGDATPTVAGAPPTPALDPATLRAGLEAHPNLRAYASARSKAQSEVELARAAKRPDWAVEASYGRRDPMFGDMVSAGVTVRLPLFASRRQDPLIAARTADAARVDVETEVARRALRAGLEADLADHLMHHEQWMRAHDVVLPAARQQADLETASYGAGRAGLSDVLQAFTDLAEARLTTLEREAAVARDAVRITLTYGADAS